MIGLPHQYSYLPIRELIEALKDQGFNIGVEHYTDLKCVLDEMAFDNRISNHDLRHVLCPLFATNAEEQDLFHSTFDKVFSPDESWKRDIPRQAAPIPPPTPPRKKVKSSSPAAWTSLVTIFLLIVTQSIRLYKNHLMEVDLPDPGIITSLHTNPGSPPISGPPPLPIPDAADVPEIDFQPENIEIFDSEKFTQPNVERFRIDNPWWNENEHFIKWWYLCAIFGMFGIYELFLLQKRRRVSKQKESREEGVPIQLEIEERFKIAYAPSFNGLATQMRKRHESGVFELDIKETVRSTARHGGMLHVEFSEHSRTAEYIVLIDRQALRNQQTAFFERQLAVLQNDGVHLSVWYFSGTPKTLTQRNGDNPVSLGWLRYHFGGSRLLLFGDGAGMMRPGNQELFDWTHDFQDFELPVIITPKPIVNWGKQEELLAGSFHVIPYGGQGFEELKYFYETGNATDQSTLKFQGYDPDDLLPESNTPEEQLAAIKTYLTGNIPPIPGNADLFDWFSACCIHPHLYMDLTLYLGKLLSGAQHNLLTQENIERLTSLPSFREGKIAPRLRLAVLGSPEWKKSPYNKQALIAIHDKLAASLKEEESTLAWDEERLNLIVVNLLKGAKGKEKRRLMDEMKLLQTLTKSDDPMVRYFLQQKSHLPGDRLLPKRLQRGMYKDGMGHNGLKPVVRLIGFAFLFLTPAILMDMSFNEDVRFNIHYNSKSYAANTPDRAAAFYTYEASFYHDNQPHDDENPHLEETMARAFAADPDYLPARVNKVVQHYNVGLGHYLFDKYSIALAQLSISERYADGLDSLLQIERDSLMQLANMEGDPQERMHLTTRAQDLQHAKETLDQTYPQLLHLKGICHIKLEQHVEAYAYKKQLDEMDPDYFENLPVPNLGDYFRE